MSIKTSSNKTIQFSLGITIEKEKFPESVDEVLNKGEKKLYNTIHEGINKIAHNHHCVNRCCS